MRRRHPNAAYSYTPEDTVVADFVEFSNSTIAEVEEGIRTYQLNVRREWRTLRAASFGGRSEVFYGASTHYIYDIVYGARSKRVVVEKLQKFNPRLLDLIRTNPGRRLVDFGGGTGVFCEIALDLGKTVTYIDIPGRVSDFARWRFEKHSLPVTFELTSAEAPVIEATYDIVYSDAVLEHLPPAKQLEVVDVMCGAVDSNGLLVLLVDLSGPTRDNPTHSLVDIAELHARIERHGFANLEGRDHFCSIWHQARNRPAIGL